MKEEIKNLLKEMEERPSTKDNDMLVFRLNNCLRQIPRAYSAKDMAAIRKELKAIKAIIEQ